MTVVPLLLLLLTAVFTEADFVQQSTTTTALIQAAAVSERALFPKRSTAPPVGGTTDQICGYITGDALNPLACADGQFCHHFPGYMGCCKTAIAFNTTYTETQVYTVSYSLTASNTVTDVVVQTQIQPYYSYHDCEYVTTCYNSDTLYYSSICEGACRNNTKNLLCTDYEFPYCLQLTMTDANPVGTGFGIYTAFICEGAAQLSTAVPLSAFGDLASSLTAELSSSIESSSFSPTHYIHTDATQASIPAVTQNRGTAAAPTATSGVCRSVTGGQVFGLLASFVHLAAFQI